MDEFFDGDLNNSTFITVTISLNEKCLYYQGMAERTGWVQPPQSLLFVEIRYRVFGVGFLENIRGRVFGKYNKSGGCWEIAFLRAVWAETWANPLIWV